MNAAVFKTSFFRVVWMTEGRKQLFASLDDRKGVEVLVASISKMRKLVAHQINAKDDRLHAMFEVPHELENQVGELLVFVKQAVEAAIISKRPELGRIWDDRNSFERVEPGMLEA
jgi:hypothetical protein